MHTRWHGIALGRNACADTCINTQHYNKSQTRANRAAAGDTGYTGYSYPSEWEVTARVFFPFSLLTQEGHLRVWFQSTSTGRSINIRSTLVLFSVASLVRGQFSEVPRGTFTKKKKLELKSSKWLRKHSSWRSASASNLWPVIINMWGNTGGKPFETICPTKWCPCQALWAFCWALKLPGPAEGYILLCW